MPPSAADAANQELVDRLIAEGALWSPPLIAAFRATPRHLFLHRVYQWQRKDNRWREKPANISLCRCRPIYCLHGSLDGNYTQA